MKEIKRGSLIKVPYEGREFSAIVIDPDGLGGGQPTVGFGFTMMEQHSGLPQSTSSGWVIGSGDDRLLKLPSGNTYRVIEFVGEDGNDYSVLEATDWFEVAFDLLEKPGRTSKSLRPKLLAFLRWFAIKGFYAEAYTVLKGAYTAKDSRATTRWLEARYAGIPRRNEYTDLLQAQGCTEGYQYARWTDYVYIGLFNMRAWEMRKFWKLMQGDPSIGRNYIPEARGVEAVAFCEEMVVKIFAGDLQEAHDDAIRLTLRKYLIEGDIS